MYYIFFLQYLVQHYYSYVARYIRLFNTLRMCDKINLCFSLATIVYFTNALHNHIKTNEIVHYQLICFSENTYIVFIGFIITI